MEPDWNEAPEWANYHTIDLDGEKRWHEQEPYSMSNGWWVSDGMEEVYGLPLCFDWKESLRKRP